MGLQIIIWFTVAFVAGNLMSNKKKKISKESYVAGVVLILVINALGQIH